MGSRMRARLRTPLATITKLEWHPLIITHTHLPDTSMRIYCATDSRHYCAHGKLKFAHTQSLFLGRRLPSSSSSSEASHSRKDEKMLFGSLPSLTLHDDDHHHHRRSSPPPKAQKPCRRHDSFSPYKQGIFTIVLRHLWLKGQSVERKKSEKPR